MVDATWGMIKGSNGRAGNQPNRPSNNQSKAKKVVKKRPDPPPITQSVEYSVGSNVKGIAHVSSNKLAALLGGLSITPPVNQSTNQSTSHANNSSNSRQNNQANKHSYTPEQPSNQNFSQPNHQSVNHHASHDNISDNRSRQMQSSVFGSNEPNNQPNKQSTKQSPMQQYNQIAKPIPDQRQSSNNPPPRRQPPNQSPNPNHKSPANQPTNQNFNQSSKAKQQYHQDDSVENNHSDFPLYEQAINQINHADQYCTPNRPAQQQSNKPSMNQALQQAQMQYEQSLTRQSHEHHDEQAYSLYNDSTNESYNQSNNQSNNQYDEKPNNPTRNAYNNHQDAYQSSVPQHRQSLNQPSYNSPNQSNSSSWAGGARSLEPDAAYDAEMAKKLRLRADLELQMNEKAARKANEKRERELREMKEQESFMLSNNQSNGPLSSRRRTVPNSFGAQSANQQSPYSDAPPNQPVNRLSGHQHTMSQFDSPQPFTSSVQQDHKSNQSNKQDQASEIRSHNQQSSIFGGQSEFDQARKQRVKEETQAVLREQIESKRRAAAAAKEREAELERREMARLERDRLEMAGQLDEKHGVVEPSTYQSNKQSVIEPTLLSQHAVSNNDRLENEQPISQSINQSNPRSNDQATKEPSRSHRRSRHRYSSDSSSDASSEDDRRRRSRRRRSRSRSRRHRRRYDTESESDESNDDSLNHPIEPQPSRRKTAPEPVVKSKAAASKPARITSKAPLKAAVQARKVVMPTPPQPALNPRAAAQAARMEALAAGGSSHVKKPEGRAGNGKKELDDQPIAISPVQALQLDHVLDQGDQMESISEFLMPQKLGLPSYRG